MKVRDLKLHPTRVGRRHQLIIKIETDEGVSGWGESGLIGRELAVMGALRHYRELIIGKNPFNIGAIWQDLYRSQYFEGGRVLTAAISAIDVALHDLKGKALGVPVYQLLGGKHRDWVPLFATTHAPMGPKLLEDAALLMGEGWNIIRTTMHSPHELNQAGESVYEPWESIGPTAHWLNKLRDASGSLAVIGIDYHHRLSVAEAASFCQKLGRDTLDFLEEPIRDETPEAYEALRRMTHVPFAIGEEFSSKWQFLPYIERGITNYARVDVCNVGGLTEAMKVAGWAEAHYIDLMPHNPLGPICTAATAHLAAAVPNFASLEIRQSPTEQSGFYDERLFPVQHERVGPRLIISDRPGLGVEFDEHAGAHEEFEPDLGLERTRYMRRRDGSLTNW
ncbi:MAG: mandelate racemase/muconate lactonizing enzyme family protein [Proteobacteria bacterium]|jgi:galactonate dehydratase|nr:mandelate racemase/muconate lactonizing enzyme family protein [Pseudomonadota bacterium]NBT04362.1 mandelate racemase/muconate lactonizing enzyme family protein [Pseudomonadota bacterium]NBT20061.1 mandelate racemase/muconate lactonizing enzyme family protein [Pseudomonadota bacterium]NBY46178.1 mandelate racemase/muconate lactonizing enzyme family protein [Pseudomonadota bacterium]